MIIHHRPYQGPDDDQPIRDLISQCYAITGHPYFAIDPPNWERFIVASEDGRNVHVWEVGEESQRALVGMAMYPKNQGDTCCLIHPNHRDVEDSLYDWLENEFAAVPENQQQERVLRVSVCEQNQSQQAILTRRGYRKGRLGVVFRKRLLGDPIEEASLPERYRIQEVHTLSGSLFSQKAQVEGEVMDWTVSVESLRKMRHAPIYRPELDLVIIGPEGTIAAFCSSWFDARNQVGFIEPVGTAELHRRRGLGKAILLEGFSRLQKLGATVVTLGHSVDNDAGNRLYDAVGMAIFDQECVWQKE